MSLFKQLLNEITLSDHYKLYIEPNLDLDYDTYAQIAKLDPTTTENKKGKYVDWIVKTFVKSDGTWDVHLTYMNNVKEALIRFISNPIDINKFKSYQELYDYTQTIPEKSKRKEKESRKSIYNSPDDIKILDETEDWVCFQTLTREGNILGAQWKTSPQANWCTAYLDRDNYWRDYSRRGDLIQLINKKNPYKKYQLWIDKDEIKESRDYDDRTSNYPQQIIEKELPNFEDNYGKLEEKEPFKYILDEEGAANYLYNEDFDNIDEYINRQPDEDEYDFYYEEAYNNVEYQINHWDRFLEEAFDIYDRWFERIKTTDRFEHIANDFLHPITGEEPFAAQDAVYDMYATFNEKFQDFVLDDEENKPDKNDYEDYDEFENVLYDWYNNQRELFKEENDVRWNFIQLFIDAFPFDDMLKIDDYELYGYKDNSDEQTSFKFEKLSKLFHRYLIEEDEMIDYTVPDDTETEKYGIDGLIDDTENDGTDVEKKEEEPIEDSIRLLSIDKRKCNKELQELFIEPLQAIPLTKIKEILKKYNITILETEEKKFSGKDGNLDFDILIDDVLVSNSCLVIYWSKQNDGINVNVYLG